jgi:cyclophilin family peptidyl-prolyl cis-trans isomerase
MENHLDPGKGENEMKRFVQSLFAVVALFSSAAFAADAKTNPQVRLTTDLGAIEIELYADKAPVTVKNFLQYVDAGFYDGTIFHRVIANFMIQGGGFEPGLKQKSANAPIQNEADNGLKNTTGTLAMARTSDPHSASAQFFINAKDNEFLNHRGKNGNDWGYAVFGKVTKGMDVVKKIEAVATTMKSGHGDVPAKDVVIRKAERIKK